MLHEEIEVSFPKKEFDYYEKLAKEQNVPVEELIQNAAMTWISARIKDMKMELNAQQMNIDFSTGYGDTEANPYSDEHIIKDDISLWKGKSLITDAKDIYDFITARDFYETGNIVSRKNKEKIFALLNPIKKRSIQNGEDLLYIIGELSGELNIRSLDNTRKFHISYGVDRILSQYNLDREDINKIFRENCEGVLKRVGKNLVVLQKYNHKGSQLNLNVYSQVLSEDEDIGPAYLKISRGKKEFLGNYLLTNKEINSNNEKPAQVLYTFDSKDRIMDLSDYRKVLDMIKIGWSSEYNKSF